MIGVNLNLCVFVNTINKYQSPGKNSIKYHHKEINQWKNGQKAFELMKM